VALLGGLVVTLISVVLHMRSARLRTERSAKRQLEERVEQRTNELRSAHDALEAEIEERSRIDGELHRARGQLAQANRLAAIGQAFAGLAHEINQPLTALKTALASSRLLAARGQTQELDETIDGMMQTVDRMAELSQDLKDLARRREHRRERVSLAAEAARVVNLVRFRATDSGTTIVMEERDRGIVIGDPVRLQQVAMNLVLNALDAVAGCEHRLVRVSVDRVDGMAELRVADSGAGISPEQRGRLFEPFFTTKAEGHGLGLGLAISNSTVREHGGTVTGTANEGGGAVFCVRIPLAEAPAGQAAADAAMPQ
jgi:two-component system C4-dicarboxylate transport sensor histidine kinase DctB